MILEGGSEGIFCYLAVNFFGLLFVFHCQAPSRTLTGQSGGFLRVTLLRPGGNRWFAARTSGCAASLQRALSWPAANSPCRRIGHSQKRCSYKQACIASFFLLSCPDSMLEHVFNKYPIPPRRVLDEYMGHSSDQFPILYYRRS